jgi:phosphatidylserine/phosphatidylglycerophosphate/cardiolipin synthase-like enzyme
VHNDEAVAIVVGASFGREMKAMFERDLARAHPIDPTQWAARNLKVRLHELWARTWAYWL